ncbi:putative importin 11 [Xylariaceae sp. FL0594]|nr:putative importin 11 [Xylariaceae sp. FL0594]
MNFAVEVPGAASPLTRVELVRTLQAASSQYDTKRKAAGQQLSSWADNEEYYPCLQDIFLDNTLPREIRLLAIIQLKNGIDIAWRFHTLSGAITAPQRARIRANLFRGTIDEPDAQLAMHNALVTAKIVRVDYPSEWPSALDELVAHLAASRDDERRLAGGLELLLRIVKELNTARLQRSKKALQAASPLLVQALGEIYDAKARQWMTMISTGQDGSNNPAIAMQSSLTALKALRRLIVAGYEQPHKDEVARQVWAFSQSQLGQLFGMVSDKYPAIGLHLIQITKLHDAMAWGHPVSFAALPGSAELVRAYWNLVAQFSTVYEESDGLRQAGSSEDEKSKTEGPLQEKLALRGLLLMRAVVKLVENPVQSIKYRSKEDVEEDKAYVEQLKQQVFSDDFVNQMAQTIISRLLRFRKADLEAWEEDPQEWEQQEHSGGNAYQWEVGPCAGKLFLDLLTYYRPLLLQPLLAYFDTAKDPQSDLLAREAVYTVLGLTASSVEDNYDFSSLLTTVIASDAQLVDPMAKVIRRRIAILLGQMSPMKYSGPMHLLVPQIFSHFLNPNDPHNDIVVRITAARQFDTVFNDWSFELEPFLPMAPDFLRELISLVQTVENDEAKLAIMETLRGLINRLDALVPQFSDLIMDSLPRIWDSAGPQGFMLKQSVLLIMLTLVITMKTEHVRYQHLMVPLVAATLQEDNENHIHFAEDAIELWTQLITQSRPPLSPGLLQLTDVVLQKLADQTLNDQMYLQVLLSYLCLAPQTMLDDMHRQPVVKALLSGLSGSHSQKSIHRLKDASKCIQVLIRFSQQLGGQQGFQVLMRDFVDAGLVRFLLDDIHDSFEAHQATGPRKRQPRRTPQYLSHDFNILARIAVTDPAIFAAMLETVGPLESTWSWLSAEWFGVLDSIAELDELKLNLLGLTRLLELPQPVAGLVVTKLQDYLSMWTSIVSQLWDRDKAGDDTLVLDEKLPSTQWDTAVDVAERELHQMDPVRTVAAHGFVKERLQNLAGLVGEQAFAEWLDNVDRDVLEGFQTLEAKNNAID